MQQADFLQTQLLPLLRRIPEHQLPLWGKMNLQQMIEHLSREGFEQAAGRIPAQLLTDAAMVSKMQDFIRSAKPFKENTKNALMPEEPYPCRTESVEAALTELHGNIELFFQLFREHPERKVLNPFFGNLDYELSVLLLYKHCLHHLRQFGVTVA